MNMTGETNILASAVFEQIVNQRSSIWKEFDEARAQKTKLDSFVKQFQPLNNDEEFPVLDNGKTPSERLSMAVKELEKETRLLQSAQSKKESYKNKIESIRLLHKFIIIGAVMTSVAIITLIL